MSHHFNRVSTLLAGMGTAAFFVLAGAAPSLAVTPVPFAPNPSGTNPFGAPVGFSYAGNKFVGTVLGDGTGRMYSTDLSGNTIAAFGGTVNLQNGHGQEHYVSSSIGLGGFANGDVFVASSSNPNFGNIQRISNAGVPDPGFFVNGSTGLVGQVRGITFDAVGTFSNDMIVTTDLGYVYTIDSLGNATNIAQTGEDTEGLDIAPLGGNWGSLNGWLFVASENSGLIRAIKPGGGGAMVPVTTVPSAEELDFVPLNLGASGSPLEGLYSANYPNNVLRTPASDFTSYIGDIIITGETNQNIYDVAPGASPIVSVVGNIPNQPEDGLFVTASMVVPEPGTLSLLGMGSVMLLRRRHRS